MVLIDQYAVVRAHFEAGAFAEAAKAAEDFIANWGQESKRLAQVRLSTDLLAADAGISHLKVAEELGRQVNPDGEEVTRRLQAAKNQLLSIQAPQKLKVKENLTLIDQMLKKYSF